MSLESICEFVVCIIGSGGAVGGGLVRDFLVRGLFVRGFLVFIESVVRCFGV